MNAWHCGASLSKCTCRTWSSCMHMNFIRMWLSIAQLHGALESRGALGHGTDDVHLWGDTPTGFGATELWSLQYLRNIEMWVLFSIVTPICWTDGAIVMQFAPKWYTAHALSDDIQFNGDTLFQFGALELWNWLRLKNIGMLGNIAIHISTTKKAVVVDVYQNSALPMYIQMMSTFVVTPGIHLEICRTWLADLL